MNAKGPTELASHPLAGVLTAAQLASAVRVVDEESRQREHLVLAVSGAHAYGFPSPDSDVDVKGIYIAKTRAILGLDPIKSSYDRLEIVAGVEIDYTANELGAVIAGVLAGNGNYLERILGKHLLVTDARLEELRPLVKQAVNRRVYHHYRGFAHNQLGRFEKAPEPEVKKALYVLRTTLTGAHLLTTGQLVTDVRELLDGYGFANVAPLIVAKSRGERITLKPAEAARWRGELKRAFEALEAAYNNSSLPDSAPNRAALESWLVDFRVRNLDS